MNGSKIFVFCPDAPKPVGGVRWLYRHVDVLHDKGFDAAIVHRQKGFHIDWLPHDTPVTHEPVAIRKSADVAVFPEVWGPKINEWGKEIRKVIFNQNAYYTYHGNQLHGPIETPYTRPEVIATIVMSEDSREYLKRVFPQMVVHRIWWSVDRELHLPRPKKKQICVKPQKNVEDVKQVLNNLHFRGALAGWRVVLLDGLSDEKAAEAMDESVIYLSFDSPEGFAQGMAEAMWAGCVVIGYSGGGGRELLDPDFSFEVRIGEIWEFVETVERVMKRYEINPEYLHGMGRAAKAFVEKEYSEEKEKGSIVACWNEILGGLASV